MTRFEGAYAALDNRCPHQGGPLGEGSNKNGWLRCPWHGWDYHPTTGKSPGSFDDGIETFDVDIREDGVYVGFPEEQPHQRTVSDLMVETMVNWGIKHVFGMVGHSNLGLADAIRRFEEDGKLNFFGIRHEGAASFACSAYGKLTGKPAACLSIAGPGATNLLTGLWDAHVDRAPVLALTGQVDTQVLGPGAFQEVDLQAAFGKVAFWSQSVLHKSRHAELMNLACKSALINRGVSHLVFPDEVQTLDSPETKKAGSPSGRIPAQDIAPSTEAISEAAALLTQSRRPVIIVGHGARFQMEAVLNLAETYDIPIITTFKAKGLVSDGHPLACGVLGKSGTPIASWFMNEADCLLVLGASFSNHTGITPKKPTIQVDLDAMTLGKFFPVDVPVLGDISVTLMHLEVKLQGKMQAETQRNEVAQRWKIWREEKTRRLAETNDRGVSSAAIFAAMNEQVPENAIIAVDVGNNTYSFGRYFEPKSHAVLMSGYLGSIGFSLPAAMGAWAATQEPDSPFFGRPVVSISGDGGFGQYMGELTTIAKYNMNITHVLLNNSELGKISKEQRSGNWDVWQTSLHNPNFADFATNCGIKGIRVTSQEELERAFTEALNHPGPALVEIISAADLL
jgi:thiamine pyrophosphate-dependent acetolactate synthase large subunit-like protein